MYYREPFWQAYNFLHQGRLSPVLADWLSAPGSLTQRLQQHTSAFEVDVLAEYWAAPFLSERKHLHLLAKQRAFIREVRLVCDGQAWVFARTVIPRASLQGKNSLLRYLGSLPLGHLLFSYADLKRSPFEVARIQPGHYYYKQANASRAQLWGRRSVFYLSGKPLLVTEVFTENFPFYG